MTRCGLAVFGMVVALATPALAQESATCIGAQDACQQIRKLGSQFDAAFGKNAGDVAALFTSEAIIMVPGPPLSGRQAIENGYRAAFEKGWTGHVFKFDQVHVTGDMAWAVGSWSANGPGPGKSVQQYNGNWGSAYAKEGSTWRIQMLTWNMMPTNK